jgi:hypothetical protein
MASAFYLGFTKDGLKDASSVQMSPRARLPARYRLRTRVLECQLSLSQVLSWLGQTRFDADVGVMVDVFFRRKSCLSHARQFRARVMGIGTECEQQLQIGTECAQQLQIGTEYAQQLQIGTECAQQLQISRCSSLVCTGTQCRTVQHQSVTPTTAELYERACQERNLYSLKHWRWHKQ